MNCYPLCNGNRVHEHSEVINIGGFPHECGNTNLYASVEPEVRTPRVAVQYQIGYGIDAQFIRVTRRPHVCHIAVIEQDANSIRVQRLRVGTFPESVADYGWLSSALRDCRARTSRAFDASVWFKVEAPLTLLLRYAGTACPTVVGVCTLVR